MGKIFDRVKQLLGDERTLAVVVAAEPVPGPAPQVVQTLVLQEDELELKALLQKVEDAGWKCELTERESAYGRYLCTLRREGFVINRLGYTRLAALTAAWRAAVE